MIRVLIVEPHPELRAGLQELCAECHDLEVVQSVASTEELLRQVPLHHPQAVVMRLGSVPQASFAALEALKAAHPDIPAVVLSLYHPDEYALRALEAGASGYLMMEQARTQLPETLRMLVLSGPLVQDAFAAI